LVREKEVILGNKLKFAGKSHKKALGDMLRFLDSAEDRVYMLSGEPGIGKSRVLNEFMESKIFQGNLFVKKFIIYRDESVETILNSWLEELLSSMFVFKGNKQRWKKMIEAIPEFGKGLSLFIKEDNRPAKQKFLKVLNLLSDEMDADERLVIVIDPFVDLKTHENADVLLHFANESPEKVKFVIAQRTSDLLANDSNFIRLVGKNKSVLGRLDDADIQEILCDDEQLQQIGEDKRSEFTRKVGGWPLALDRYSQKIEQSTESPETVIDSLPKDLEIDVKNNYEELDIHGSQISELLSLLGIFIDFQTLAKLSKLGESDLSDALKSKTLNRLVKSESTKGEPRLFGMRHALYAQWIVDLLRELIDVPARYKEIAAFFKERFDENDKCGQDLVHYVNYLYAAGDEENFVKETSGVCQDMYRLALYDSSLDLEQKRLALARKTGDRKIEGEALNNIGSVYWTWGQYDEALKYYKQSLKIQRVIGNRSGEETTLSNMGAIYFAQGKNDEALKNFKQSLKTTCLIKDRKSEGISLNNIGMIYRAWGENEKALEYFQQSLKIRRKTGDRYGEAKTLNNIGGIYYTKSQYDEALKYYKQSLDIKLEIGDRHGEGVSLNNISQVYDAWGKYDEALKYLKQSLEISREIGDHFGEGTTLNNIGKNFFAWGKNDEALEYFKQSLEISREIGNRDGEALARHNMAHIFEKQGNIAKAVEFEEIAVKIFEELRSPNLQMAIDYLNHLRGRMKAEG
jgi:tetratricopeptide (TPR) repeat protein